MGEVALNIKLITLLKGFIKKPYETQLEICNQTLDNWALMPI